MTALLAAGPACAFDPTGADIVGLRLGMSETDIEARLEHQGFKMDRTPEGMEVRTLDGRLHITLSPERGATEIVYVFDYGGKLVSQRLFDSILSHFGDPVQTHPMMWCLVPYRFGDCPDDRASMTLLPEKLTLMLRAAPEAPR